jgi:ribosome biogenesis GTPase
VIETASAERLLCQLAGRRLEVVCGDEVHWHPSGNAREGIVVERLPRRSTLSRTDGVGRCETVVANVTQLLVVLAPQPEPDFFIIDRYVAAAELTDVPAVLVLNKADLPDYEPKSCRAELAMFARNGYPALECSATTGFGLEQLAMQLKDHTTVVVGQSGVGKTSLANRLLPGLDAVTAELSRATAEGKHTTSVSTLHHLPSGGDLIDSPGVRDFAPAIELLTEPARGFREIHARAKECRFKDCRHLREPNCAVRAAVETGVITERRYESYRRLLRLSEDLAPDPARMRRV